MRDTVSKANKVIDKMLKFCGGFEQSSIEYQNVSTISEDSLSFSVVAAEHDWYRARVMYKHFGDMGGSVNICCHPKSQLVSYLNNSKFIIASKINDNTIYPIIQQIAKENNSKIVFDIDDNFHNIDRVNPNYHFYDPELENGRNNIQVLEHNIAASDFALYSTRELLAYYKHLNPNCSFFPNYLDIQERYAFKDRFDWKPKAKEQGCNVNEDSILIGFFGSNSHVADLDEILEPIIQLLRENDNVFFGLICEYDMALHLCMRNHKVPSNKLVYFDCVSYIDYPYKLTCFDIALAPLRNTIFNRCRTPLKLCEYGALSIPYVASKVANNQRLHIESGGVGGFIADTNDDWYEHLKTLIDNPELRKKMGEEFKEFVYNHYDVTQSFLPMTEMFRTIDNNKNKKFNHPTPYDLADSYDGIPEVKLKYVKTDFCPCGSGELYLNCKNNCYPAWGYIQKQ